MGLTGDRIELRLGDEWVDITGDVYERDPISISRGVPDQGTQADPGKCTLTINNREGKYSPRNPMSPYYGVIGRNTPLRVNVPAGETFLQLDGSPDGQASTPYTTSMDAVNGIDIRVDCAVDWAASGTQTLAGRATATDRTWVLRLASGSLRFEVYDTATTTRFTSRALPDDLPARAVVRAVYSENHGAGTRSFELLWGTSITGPWTSLGTLSDTYTATNETAAPFVVAPGIVATTGEKRYPAPGRFYAARLYNATGTLISNIDFSAQTPGDTSFPGATGLVWSLSGTAEIRDRADRFMGEVSSWPLKWDLSQADVYTPIEASGILRRLGQGQQPLDSTLRRRIPSQPNLLAYWPMEEGAGATQAYSPVPGVQPLKLTNTSWASVDTLPSSSPLPAISPNSGTVDMYGRVPAPSTATPTGWLVRWVYRLDTVPTGGPWTFMRALTTGTVWEWYIQSDNTGTRILGNDIDGNSVVNQAVGTGTDLFNQWIDTRFSLSQSGSTVTWTIAWQDVGGDTGQFSSTFTGSMGRVSAVASPPNGYATALDGMAIGHISVWSAPTTAAYDGAITAYAGESTLTRMVRLSSEENLPLSAIDGDSTTNSEAMGAQRPETLLDLLSECAAVDGGLLTEDRERLALRYRDRATLYNQSPALTLDYSAGQVWAPFEPVDDDTDVHNDVTVSRDGGSSARATLTDGPLSVQPPPLGVGAYSDSVTLNLANDDQPAPHAYWRMYLGTVDEARYPSVTVLLHAAPDLIPDVLALNEGDKILITNVPNWVSADDIELLVDGYSETVRLDQWEITFNCRPAGPWNVGVVEDTVYGRADTDGSTLTSDVTASVTTLSVFTPSSPWVQSATLPGEFPLDIQVGGETCTVSAIADRPSDDFTRTVSNGWGTAANGLVWHPAGYSSLSEFSVNGSAGVMTIGTGFGNPRFMQDLDVYTDCELLVAITSTQLAVGDLFLPGFLLRASGGYYRCRLRLGTDGSVGVDVHNSATGVVGSAVAAGFTYAAGTKLWFRMNITGQRVLGRVWKDGTTEPGTWTLDQTVSTSAIASGAIGLTASVGTGCTNVSPSFLFDDFNIVSPKQVPAQFFTVTRSANGIVKSQTAGTDIRLAQPTIIAL